MLKKHLLAASLLVALAVPALGAEPEAKGSCQVREAKDYLHDFELAGLPKAKAGPAAKRHVAEGKQGCPTFKTEALCRKARSKELNVTFASCRWVEKKSAKKDEPKKAEGKAAKQAPPAKKPKAHD